MSGTRTYAGLTWTNDVVTSPAGPINATRLGHMDQGVSDAFDLANEKVTFQGNWDVEVDNYYANDMVLHNGQLYITPTDITDNSEPGTESPWGALIDISIGQLADVSLDGTQAGQVLTWNADEGVWTNATPDSPSPMLPASELFDNEASYSIGALVYNADDGMLYQANQAVAPASTPAFNHSQWNLLGIAVQAVAADGGGYNYSFAFGDANEGSQFSLTTNSQTGAIQLFMITDSPTNGTDSEPLLGIFGQNFHGLQINANGSLAFPGMTAGTLVVIDGDGTLATVEEPGAISGATFQSYRSLGTYDAGTVYTPGDYVKTGDSTAYVCIDGSTGVNPATDANKWAPIDNTVPVVLVSKDSLQAENPASAATPAAPGSIFLYSVGGAFTMYTKNDGRDFAWGQAMVQGTHLNVGNGIVFAEDNDGTLGTIAIPGDDTLFLDGTGAFSAPAGGGGAFAPSSLLLQTESGSGTLANTDQLAFAWDNPAQLNATHTATVDGSDPTRVDIATTGLYTITANVHGDQFFALTVHLTTGDYLLNPSWETGAAQEQSTIYRGNVMWTVPLHAGEKVFIMIANNSGADLHYSAPTAEITWAGAL